MKLSGQKCKFFCLSIPQKNLDTKKTTINIEVCPESLRAMFEYWYINGLLINEICIQSSEPNELISQFPQTSFFV